VPNLVEKFSDSKILVRAANVKVILRRPPGLPEASFIQARSTHHVIAAMLKQVVKKLMLAASPSYVLELFSKVVGLELP
jgi:hypothetical protein